MGKYYNGDELLSRHYNINFVCGSRLGGKSTWAQRYVLRKAIKNIKKNFKNNIIECTDQFAILVRYEKDIDILCKTYFNNTLEQWYPGFHLEYEAKKFYFTQSYEDIKGNEVERKILIGYAFALNNATKMKSTSYPNINTIIMEEFMNLEGKYIKSKEEPELEVELLISLFSTIARGKGRQFRDDVRVLCISNNFYLDNPYFKYFDLIQTILDNPNKRFYEKKTEPKCIVEMIKADIDISVGRDSKHQGSVFIDSQNQLRIVKDPVVNMVPMQLSMDNREFLNVARYNDSFIIFTNKDKIRPNTEVYSCASIKRQGISHISIFKKSKAFIQLVNEYSNNNLFYDCLETYIIFKNILAFNGVKS